MFFSMGRLLNTQKKEIFTQAYLEGIHVDGYSTWFKANTSGTMSLVNIYAHHATSNGIVTDAIKLATKFSPQGTDTQIGGSELAIGGQGNTEHCIYYHGSSLPGVQQKLSMTGNLIHSCNWSSAIKSIAQYNDIDGNRILKTLETDPTYSRKHSVMLADIAACSETYIRGNYFEQIRPFETTPGGAAVSSRSRKSFFGCNWPELGWDDANVRHPIKRPESEFWDPAYWAEVNGGKTIPFIVKGNTFVSGGYQAGHQVAIEASGTIPNYTYTLGGWACYLEPPANWTERSMV